MFTRRLGAIALIAVCGMLAGCQKIDDIKKQAAPLMKFRVSAAETKAAENTTDGLNTTGESFSIIAVADAASTDGATGATIPAGKYFDAVLKYDGSSWGTYDTSTGDAVALYWLNDVGIHMWSYYPSSLGTATGSPVRTITDPAAASDKLSFTYKQPAPTTTFVDATKQVDIIFAGNKEEREFNDAGEITTTGKDETVDIEFYHALSEIRFCVSTDDGTFDPGLTITKVAIVNAAGSGSCKFTVPSTSPTTLFDWSELDDRTTYSQTFGTLPTASNSEWNVGTYTHSTLGTKNLYRNLNSFFMIPESDLSDISIEVTFLLSDGTTSVTKNLALSSSDSWVVGYYYTYKIKAEITTDISLALELLDWNLIEEDIELDNTISATGKLDLSPKSGAAGSHDAIADGGLVAGSFTIDTPIGATWLVSVTNPEVFSVSGENGSSDPAYGTVDGGAQVFYITPKTGVDRTIMQKTRITISLKLADGTIVNVDQQLGNVDVSPSKAWNIILNPIK